MYTIGYLLEVLLKYDPIAPYLLRRQPAGQNELTNPRIVYLENFCGLSCI
jgi:hypothetical protein